MLRLSCGYTSIAKIRNDNVIYVDKTSYVSTLAKNRARPVFLSRPRRFGKSLLVSVFASLFSHGLRDFAGLAIAEDDYWKDEKTYRVVHLDFSSYALKDLRDWEHELTLDLQCALLGKKRRELTDAEKSLSPYSALMDYASDADTGSLVLLIDEYDAPITHSLDDPGKTKQVVDFISSFFATIKSCERIFRFVFITGITRLAHVSLFSMFNNLLDISVDDDYATLLGITEEELHGYFDPYVRNAAAVLDMGKEDLYARLKATYNGFQFAVNARETVYNPWSLLSFLAEPGKGLANYWYSTSGGTPALLVHYLKNADELELFNILRYRASSGKNTDLLIDSDSLLAKSEPDQIPMEMLLLQTGYFTLKSVNEDLARLVIPNDEIAESLIRLSLDIHNLGPTIETRSRIADLASMLDHGDVESVFRLFNTLLCECVSANSKAFGDENTIRDIIYSQIPRRRVFKAREVVNSQGMSDLELMTGNTRLVVEFKRIMEPGGEEAAIRQAFEQMKSRHYGETTEKVKLIRVAMIICTVKRSLTAYRVI